MTGDTGSQPIKMDEMNSIYRLGHLISPRVQRARHIVMPNSPMVGMNNYKSNNLTPITGETQDEACVFNYQQRHPLNLRKGDTIESSQEENRYYDFLGRQKLQENINNQLSLPDLHRRAT